MRCPCVCVGVGGGGHVVDLTAFPVILWTLLSSEEKKKCNGQTCHNDRSLTLGRLTKRRNRVGANATDSKPTTGDGTLCFHVLSSPSLFLLPFSENLCLLLCVTRIESFLKSGSRDKQKVQWPIRFEIKR